MSDYRRIPLTGYQLWKLQNRQMDHAQMDRASATDRWVEETQLALEVKNLSIQSSTREDDTEEHRSIEPDTVAAPAVWPSRSLARLEDSHGGSKAQEEPKGAKYICGPDGWTGVTQQGLHYFLDITTKQDEKPNTIFTSPPKVRRNIDGTINVKPFATYTFISRMNQINSPLLRLPSEMRNQIYDYLFSGKVYMDTQSGRREWPALYDRLGTGLICACRQLYAETALLPYNRSNEFIYETFTSVGTVRREPLHPYQLDGITKITVYVRPTFLLPLCDWVAVFVPNLIAKLGRYPVLETVTFVADPRFLRTSTSTMKYGERAIEENIDRIRSFTRAVSWSMSWSTNRKIGREITFKSVP